MTLRRPAFFGRSGALLAAGLACAPAHAVRPDLKLLPIGLAPGERPVLSSLRDAPPMTSPPTSQGGPVHSLAEWEESDAVLTLWPNPSFVGALARRGRVALIADTDVDRAWWDRWLRSNAIPPQGIIHLVTPTNSLWVRDYGPWFILDGQGRFGLVDTRYNRPRPQDDVFPVFLARQFSIPLFQPGLVHTGGNYYSDGIGSAFSSTLAYTENPALAPAEIQRRMQAYLGIERYATSRLAPGITIEHLDTFGKLVAPDTWVFGEFPAGSRLRADSEAYVTLLKTLTSPYGTPYRILRLPMVLRPGGGAEDFRAHLNSFISNGALYFPSYGLDAADAAAARVYQAALPGYEIVPVDAAGTSWGDSVHCRARNFLKRDAVFVFPYLSARRAGALEVRAEVIPSPGARIETPPVLRWRSGPARRVFTAVPMTATGGFGWVGTIPADRASFYVEAQDGSGKRKAAPIRAPQMLIRVGE